MFFFFFFFFEGEKKQTLEFVGDKVPEKQFML